MRVEQGRHPSQSGSDPKRQLVAAVESLFEQPPAFGKELIAPVSKRPETYRPPKRTYRQGEV
jgi:hypothetical protein